MICNYCNQENPADEYFCVIDGMPLFPAMGKAGLILPDRTIELDEKEASFGKEDFINDVPADKIQYISRKIKPHFRITKENNRLYIEDNNSINGTKVNDIEINPNKGGIGKTELKNGDTITLANKFTFKFQYLS